MENKAWIIRHASRGAFNPDCLALEPRPVEAPRAGYVLLRTILLSLDPTSRNWLKLDPSSNVFGLEVGSVMIGQAVSEVIQSAADGFAAGDLVVGMSGWELYSSAPAARIRKVRPGVPLEANLTIFSHIGLAAAAGMIGVGNVKESDFVVVSGAAGATGSIAAQIALARGARVIGIAGGADKCRFLIDEIGVDAVIDYKSADVEAELRRLCPEGVTLFFDNVGGAILDAVLKNLAMHARVAICGQMALYDSDDRNDGQGVRNLMELVFRRARMEGFIAGEPPERLHDYEAELAQLFDSGRIVHRTHLVSGLEAGPEALRLLFEGKNHGKLILAVSSPTYVATGAAQPAQRWI